MNVNNTYHDWVFWTLVTISSVVELIAIISLFELSSFECFMFLNIMGLFFIGFFGWILIGGVHSVVDVTRDNIAHVIKTPTSIILTIDDKPVKTITDIPTFNYLSDKTNIMLTRDGWINIYGTTNWWHEYSLKF
jgi:hypothetical protein